MTKDKQINMEQKEKTLDVDVFIGLNFSKKISSTIDEYLKENIEFFKNGVSPDILMTLCAAVILKFMMYFNINDKKFFMDKLSEGVLRHAEKLEKVMEESK